MPEAAWKPKRVASDLQLSKKLLRKLDAELGITDGPFAPEEPAAPAPVPAPAAGGRPS